MENGNARALSSAIADTIFIDCATRHGSESPAQSRDRSVLIPLASRQPFFDSVKDKYQEHQEKVAELKDTRGDRLGTLQVEYMGGNGDQKRQTTH